MSRSRPLFRVAKRRLFTFYLLAGGLTIFLGVNFFTFRLTNRIEAEAQHTTWLLSHYASRNIGTGSTDSMRELVRRIDDIEVPFIVTDNKGRPVLWNEPVIGIPMPARMLELQAVDPEGENDPDIERILDLVEHYDRQHEPFAIISPEKSVRVGTLHYGSSSLSRSARWLPRVEMILMAGFFMLIFWALGVKRRGDQQRLFAGMAKETAHQLGTPITSIMGWLEVLRERQPQRDLVVEELADDVRRLGKVSERFSQIGSRPSLAPTDLGGIIESTLAYFSRRLPHLGGEVDLLSEGSTTRVCRLNHDLMEWVLENLIKNGIDALKGEKGSITVRLADGPGSSIQILVSDTGCGVPAKARNRIFEPGFTTKSRGWGMGLALVKRIVEQYHGGRIQLQSTGPEGTTFAINLPGEEGNGAVQHPVG